MASAVFCFKLNINISITKYILVTNSYIKNKMGAGANS